ncbi:MAG: ribosomal L7Ae/L30e/S12e/Gadd45 family protein [Phascolarctobacterium sp.]|nr:ribosomal L7Ae/L30e/S12e/Gadd45 family protein [Phascolarctobacterium sp.]
MELEALKQATQRTVGVKMTEKAVKKQLVKLVFIANDADEHVVEKLRELCETNNISPLTSWNMLELGRACGIHVKAAACAIL